MTNTETIGILRALRGLPPEKIGEVKDFAVFLRYKYGVPEVIDLDDEWSDGDLSAASFEYAHDLTLDEDAQ